MFFFFWEFPNILSERLTHAMEKMNMDVSTLALLAGVSVVLMSLVTRICPKLLANLMSRPIISTEKKANFCATFLFHYPGDAASRSHIFIA